MTAAPIEAGQLKAIHAIRRRVRLDEASYLAMLQGYGVATSKDLTRDQAADVLRKMRDIPGASSGVQRGAKDKADGKYAKPLRFFWIALWNLGEVEDNRDSAIHAFVERQTGLKHSRFLLAHADASRVIEALKDWLTRAGVDWPAETKDPGVDALARRRALLRAQWRRGLGLGVLRELPGMDEDTALAAFVGVVARKNARALGTLDCPSLTAAEADAASAALGRKIRGAKPRLEVRHVG